MCRATNVLWKEATLLQNVTSPSTVGLSQGDNHHHSNNSKAVSRHPLRDSKSHTINIAAADPTRALTAVLLAQAISSHFPSAVNGCRERPGPILRPPWPLRWCSQAQKALKGACGKAHETWTIRTTMAGRVALGAHPRDRVTPGWPAPRRWFRQNSAWIMTASGVVRWAHGSLPMAPLGQVNRWLVLCSPWSKSLKQCRHTFKDNKQERGQGYWYAIH